MPQAWLVKTDPETYSYTDLLKAGHAVWDGVANALAQKHMKAMNAGDPVLMYHTGDEKSVIGTATVSRAAYPDPKDKESKFFVVDLKAGRMVKNRVTLAEVKAEPALKDLALVRQGRLSVMPIPDAAWKILARMAGL